MRCTLSKARLGAFIRVGSLSFFVAVALQLIAVAQEKSRIELVFETAESLKGKYGPYAVEASARVAPVSLVIDATGQGTAVARSEVLSHRVMLQKYMTRPPFSCSLGDIVTPPLEVTARLIGNFGYEDVIITPKAGGPHPVGAYQQLQCRPGPKDFVILANVYASTFRVNTLEPGVRTAIMDTSYRESHPQAWVTLKSCPTVPGASGNGTVVFESQPPVNTDPWPFRENHEMTIREITKAAGRSPDNDVVVDGYTYAKFPGEQYGYPRAVVEWEDYPQGKGKCVYIDKFTIKFPEITILIPLIYWEARDQQCWYEHVRGHEIRHALYIEDGFRSMQRLVKAFLDDPTTATPAHPQYAKNDEEAAKIQRDLFAKLRALIQAEREKVAKNNDAMDTQENYRFEGGLCKLPEP